MATISEMHDSFDQKTAEQKAQFIKNSKEQLKRLKDGGSELQKRFLRECVEKYNTEVKGGSSGNLKAIANPTDSGSYFEGKFIHGLGWKLLALLVHVVTLGIAFPWAFCFVYRWKINNTVIEGHRLRFTGTGAGLFGGWIKWYFLSLITAGVYSPWAYNAFRTWQTKHTVFEEGTGESSYFEGEVFGIAGRLALGATIFVATFGFGFAWCMCKIFEWEINNVVIEGRRLKFAGTSKKLFVRGLIWWVLSIVTLGIFPLFFLNKALYRWRIENTTFAD